MTNGYEDTRLEEIHVNTKLDPLIIDDFSLAFFLGFRNKTLWHALYANTGNMYKVFKIPKKTGGYRMIHAPEPLMKHLLDRVHVRLLMPLQEKLGDHVTAYREGKSITDAVAYHIPKCKICDSAPPDKTPKKHDCPKRGVYIHMDLKNFFSNTRRAWVRNYFMHKGYSFYVSGLIAQLVTVDDIPNPRYPNAVGHQKDKLREFFTGVPQGGPTSGAICNLVADYRMDKPILEYIRELNKRHGLNGERSWRYSRYADDMTFTCGIDLTREEKTQITKEIQKVVEKSGYRINEKKTRISNSYYRKTMLGVVFNQKPNIPKEKYMRMRAIIHNCVTQGIKSQVNRVHRKDADDLVLYLRGMVSYYSQVHPKKAAKLKEELDVAIANHLKEEGAQAAC